MLKRMQKKKSENKGFTLVELIVVLVILAILAAILVPALLGYIDRAKGQQIVLNARSCYTAAQAELSSMYGKSQACSEVTNDTHKKSILDTADVNTQCQALVIGMKVDATKTTAHSNYTVAYVYYKEGDQEIWFDGKAWVEEPASQDGITCYNIKGSEPSRTPSGS